MQLPTLRSLRALIPLKSDTVIARDSETRFGLHDFARTSHEGLSIVPEKKVGSEKVGWRSGLKYFKEST
jgi:hypothetical protein